MEKTTGQRLANLREQRGMTQEELAEKSGISRARISRLENNEVDAPRYRTLEKLSAALDVQIQVLQPELGEHLAKIPAGRPIRFGDAPARKAVAEQQQEPMSDAELISYLRAKLDEKDLQIEYLWGVVLGKALGSSDAASLATIPASAYMPNCQLSVQRRVRNRE
jgi:transcriptional regulator with XRE-family HTH domain